MKEQISELEKLKFKEVADRDENITKSKAEAQTVVSVLAAEITSLKEVVAGFEEIVAAKDAEITQLVQVRCVQDVEMAKLEVEHKACSKELKVLRSENAKLTQDLGSFRKFFEQEKQNAIQKSDEAASLQQQLNDLQARLGQAAEDATQKDAEYGRETLLKLDSAIERMRQNELNAAFQKWLDAAEQRGDWLYKVKGVIKRWRQRELGEAFNQWQAAAEVLGGQAYKVNGVLRRMQHKDLSAAFNEWRL